MKILISLFLSIVPFCCSLMQADTSWYERKLEGWYYFEDRKQQEEKKELPKDEEQAEEFLEEGRLKLKKSLALALLHPSEAHLENYIKEQKKWLDQSNRFAQAWGKLLLQKPYLGDFLLNPTTTYGILATKQWDIQKRNTLLAKLSKDHFLIFFFEGKSPFSQKVAEVVQLFSSIHHWTVKAVSLDGVGLKEFPQYELDKGISKKMSVTATPSFFIVNPYENKAFPVGAGLVSLSDLEQNIEMQINPEGDDE